MLFFSSAKYFCNISYNTYVIITFPHFTIFLSQAISHPHSQQPHWKTIHRAWSILSASIISLYSCKKSGYWREYLEKNINTSFTFAHIPRGTMKVQNTDHTFPFCAKRKKGSNWSLSLDDVRNQMKQKTSKNQAGSWADSDILLEKKNGNMLIFVLGRLRVG